MSLPQALNELSQFLEREKARGTKRIAISPESIEMLKAIPHLKSETATTQRLPESKREPAAVAPASPAPAPETKASSPPPAAVSQLAGLTAPDLVEVAGETKRDRLNNLFRELKADQAAKLPTLLKTLVFAKGNPDAELMFVGEAPGADEEQQRKPFVGPSGQLLDKIIGVMGIDPSEVYVSNIVKYRPKKGDGRFQGTSNRKPDPDEMAAHLKYVLTEIEIVSPKVVIALGSTAAEGLLGLAGSVSKIRGQFYNVRSIPTRVTYHPSYLLRAAHLGDGKSEKRKVWEDFMAVMELLGMEVTEKQRGYFL